LTPCLQRFSNVHSHIPTSTRKQILP
jgi:hypothetical protein